MLPVDAVPLLGGDVAYTEEVPVRIRWVIADLGGHTVDDSDVLVTTDPDNEKVAGRLLRGDDLVRAPSLLLTMEPDREIEAPGEKGNLPETRQGSAVAGDAGSGSGTGGTGYPAGYTGYPDPQYTVSGGGYVDGEIVGSDEHTVAVAGMRRTTRTEVPGSVMDELEDAVALMTRALRQGEWEQSQTHHSLLAYLREETEELAEVIDRVDADHEAEIDQQELCRELSDILLQVLFHAEIANRRGSFDIGHVAGAFVAKMNNRAPYLFEDAERPVSREEQDRLWAEGRVREGKEPYKTAHPDPAAASAASDTGAAGAAAQSDAQSTGQHAAAQDAAAQPAQPAQPMQEQWQVAPGRDTGDSGGSAPAGTPAGGLRAAASPLAAAEEIIGVARAAGLRDTEIPTDIRFPMVGLESDAPGDAEDRLMAAVSAFRRELEQRDLA